MNNNETRRTNNNNNNNRRRSSRYSNNKNYRNNYRSHNNKGDNKKQYKKPEEEAEFSVTKQQVFDFDEMKFSDELDTSFVDSRKKKKKNIEDELNRSYEKIRENEKLRDQKEKKKVKIHKGRLVMAILFFVLLLALLIACIFILFKPVKTKVVTKEKEVVVMDDNYLFLGDSITEQYDLNEYFEDMPVVNSGVSGNQTVDVLDNLEERAYQYNPSKVFLLIGTNDIQAKVEEDEIIENIEEILKELHENRPYAELYLEAIYPVDEDQKGSQIRTNEEISSINEQLEAYCKENNITFIDTYHLLLDPDSEDDQILDDYTKDGLHITDEGYEVITKELEKYMK